MVAMFENFVSVTQEEDVPQVGVWTFFALVHTESRSFVHFLTSVLFASQVRSDWFVYVVLSCLPWVGKELYEKKDVEMDRLLSQIEGYLK